MRTDQVMAPNDAPLLSTFRYEPLNGLAPFARTLAWTWDAPANERADACAGDSRLLGELESLLDFWCPGGGTIAELGADRLQDAIATVRELHPAWQLADDDAGDVLTSLDRHFARLQPGRSSE